METRMRLTSFDDLRAEELFEGKVRRKVFQSRNIEVVEYIYGEGAHFPEHSHREEQITLVESGEITFFLDGEKVELKEGSICYIPPLMPHAATVTGAREVRTLNIFHPARKTRP